MNLDDARVFVPRAARVPIGWLLAGQFSMGKGYTTLPPGAQTQIYTLNAVHHTTSMKMHIIARSTDDRGLCVLPMRHTYPMCYTFM